MSQSALSHAIKMLEERLGVRLLSRTTRSVSVTDAGETLLRSLRPALDDIAQGVDAIGALRGKPTGTVRITATKHAVSSVVMPAMPAFLAANPDIEIDMIVTNDLIDIVAERIDAGIRFGDIVEKDMIAIRIGPDIRLAVVGAPSYFAEHGAPATPRDLAAHTMHQLPAHPHGRDLSVGVRRGRAPLPGSGVGPARPSATPNCCWKRRWQGRGLPSSMKTRCFRTSPPEGSLARSSLGARHSQATICIIPAGARFRRRCPL